MLFFILYHESHVWSTSYRKLHLAITMLVLPQGKSWRRELFSPPVLWPDHHNRTSKKLNDISPFWGFPSVCVLYVYDLFPAIQSKVAFGGTSSLKAPTQSDLCLVLQQINSSQTIGYSLIWLSHIFPCIHCLSLYLSVRWALRVSPP